MRTVALEFTPFKINVNSISSGKIYEDFVFDRRLNLYFIIDVGQSILGEEGHVVDIL